MSKSARHEEIEIKIRVPDAPALRSLLKHLHAREIAPRTHESNTLYDTPRQDLRRRCQLIRIRIEQPVPGPRKRRQNKNFATLTYKGPSPRSRTPMKTDRKAKIRAHFKIRNEAEVSIVGADQMPGILRALGLRPAFRYEKFRTTYVLPGLRGLKIELDETPVGIYLELEGPVAGIDRAARLLGYNRKDYMTHTYGSLYLADCRRRGRKPGDMLFPPTKKLR
jgi:adenylate cyclase, class 2